MQKNKGLWDFLERLKRDVRGNTIAIIAAALIPLAGMVGGGLDISRMYLTKTRLQHACDAGALAGRKAMGGGQWSNDNYAARKTAEQFFTANFKPDSYGSTGLTRSFTENASKVTGTATVKLPLTVMRIFGFETTSFSVSCDAEERLPNTDIMFVLDVTGSMNSPARSGDPVTKIVALKRSVKCFYEIIARLDTDAQCNGNPSGGTGDQVQIRFGFMPYTENVNVGKLLPPAWFANQWDYQTRKAVLKEDGTFDHWHYGKITENISALKNASGGWNNGINMPIDNPDGANRYVTWNGCIEERQTVRAVNYWPIPQGAKDLNIDLMPDTNDPSTLWGPTLQRLVFARGMLSNRGYPQVQYLRYSEIDTTDDYTNNLDFGCPREARKLQRWPDAYAFDNYVDGLSAGGGTYHDIGLLWGARFLSGTGIFRSENEFTPLGGEIQRNLIFMTDGTTHSIATKYNAYGMPWLDRRQTDPNTAPTDQDTDNQINARFSALCTAIKNKNIAIWVIAFGDDVINDAATGARLEACATSGRYFRAQDSSELQSTFQEIANQISQLRLTK